MERETGEIENTLDIIIGIRKWTRRPALRSIFRMWTIWHRHIVV